MLNGKRCAKINVKVLVILIVIIGAIVFALFAARQIRRNILSKISLEAGTEAFENQDWDSARENFKEYLGRNPDDIEILKKYAEVLLSVRPFNLETIASVVSVYRKVLELDSTDEIAYEKLAMLYGGIGNYDELAYTAKRKLGITPNDMQAQLWLADAQMNSTKYEEAQETLNKLIRYVEPLSGKHNEYVKACLMLSDIATNSNVSSSSVEKALEWINKAIEYSPESAEAMAKRAKFYYETTNIPGYSTNDRISAVYRDLESADTIGSEKPQVLFMLCSYWIGLGEYDKAAAEIEKIDNLSDETINKYFFDIQDLKSFRCVLASDIAIRQGDTEKAVSLIDEALETFKEDAQRMRIIPSAIKVYALADKVSDANDYLEEYLENSFKFEDTKSVNNEKAYLQAIVAMAQENPYAVIEILQPVVQSNASPELWRLLADAYTQTDQPRRAASSMYTYMSLRPKDSNVSILLAKEYFTMGQWKKAFDTAQYALTLIPDNLVVQLISIESGIRLAVENSTDKDESVFEDFSKELSELRQKYPKEENIRVLQASIADYLGDPNTAIDELKLAIADCNETLNAEMQLAGLYRRTDRILDAADIYEAACEKYPNSVKPRLGLSEIYLDDSNVELARKCLQEGLEIATSNDTKRSLSINLALLELLKGDRKVGIEILKDAAKQDSSDLQSRLMLLEMKEIQKDAKEVEKLINETKLIEGNAGVWWRLYQAKILLMSENWRSKEKEISDLLQNCMIADPEWAAPVLMMVDLQKKKGDLRKVEEICKQFLAKNPLASDVTNELLLVYESQGRLSEAEQILNQYNVNERFLSTWQIKMALDTGDISKAIEELKLRISNDDNDIASRIQLARLIYQQTKDSEQAFDQLDEVFKRVPDSIDALGTKAAILRANGKSQEAIDTINEFIETYESFNAYRMRAMFYEYEGNNELSEQDYRKLLTYEDNASFGYELLGSFLARTRQFEKAITEIEEGIVKYPDNLGLERILMRLLVIDGPDRDTERAGEILEKLQEQYPEDAELIKFKAALLMENTSPESVENAITLLEELVKLKPTDVDAYLMLVNISMGQQKYNAAREYVLQGLGINSNNVSLMLVRSRIELEAGQPQTAADLANAIIQKYPGNAEASDIIIQAALASRDKTLLREAEGIIETALAGNPDNERMVLTKINILMALSQSDIAISVLEDYCKTEQGIASISAHMVLSDIYRSTGDMEKAEELIIQAEKIDPGNFSITYSHFVLLISQKKYDNLSPLIDSFLSAQAKDVPVIINAATILVSQDSQELKDSGIKIFEHAYTIAPDSQDAGYSYASALYSTGNTEQAEQIYKKHLEKYPDDIRVLNDYAWILQDVHQDYEQALEFANKGVELAPENLHLLDTRGTILLKLESELGQAKDDFEKIAELAPEDSRQQAKAYLNLGRINIKLNDTSEAKRCYQKAQEINQKLNIFTQDEVTEIQENTN